MTMSSIKAGLLATVATGVVTGAVAYSGLIKPEIFDQELFPKFAEKEVSALNEQPKLSVEIQKPIQQPKAPENVSPLSELPPENTNPTLSKTTPAFDVLRMEKDGSLLIAGRAPAHSKIEVLQEDGAIIASGRTGPAGDFKATAETPLKPGQYALTIRAKLNAGEAVDSLETGIIRIPQNSEVGSVSLKEAPSQIIVKPTIFDNRPLKKIVETRLAPKPDPIVKSSVPQTQKADESKKPKKMAKLDETKSVVVSPKQGRDPIEVPTSRDVVVEAVEMENGNISIAGAAPPDTMLRIFIDEDPIGSTLGTKEDRFLITKKFDLQVGSHKVRAEVIDPESGKVMHKIEVPLIHSLKEVEQGGALVPKKSNSKDEKSIAAPKDPQKLVKTGETIIIKPGDSLWKISRRRYGRGKKFRTIFDANRDQIENPSEIYVGQVFKIPPASKPVSVE